VTKNTRKEEENALRSY